MGVRPFPGKSTVLAADSIVEFDGRFQEDDRIDGDVRKTYRHKDGRVSLLLERWGAA